MAGAEAGAATEHSFLTSVAVWDCSCTTRWWIALVVRARQYGASRITPGP